MPSAGFQRREHMIACVAGWIGFIALCAPVLPLWLPLAWGALGLLALRPRLVSSAMPGYGFLAWIGFLSAWPYVFILRQRGLA